MIDFKFDPNATYIASVSFGSDSMAMLDMLLKQGIRPVVAAIDYHKFDFSTEDMRRLGEYCKAKGLTYRLLDSHDLPQNEQMHIGDSFHDWARKLRYSWYKKLYVEYNASALFLAHEQDDLLEAYLKAKERKETTVNLGMSKISTQDGMLLVRPLLDFSKQGLLEYDIENNVPFNPGPNPPSTRPLVPPSGRTRSPK